MVTAKRIFSLLFLVFVYFWLFVAIPGIFFWDKPDMDFWALMFVAQLIGSGTNVAILAETHHLWRKNIWVYFLLLIVASPWLFLFSMVFTAIGYSVIINSFSIVGLADFLKWTIIVIVGGFSVIVALAGYSHLMQKTIHND